MKEKTQFIIDDITAQLLAKIAQTKDDAVTLVKIGSVDPDEFRMFLEEIGEINNPYAVALLNAARQLKYEQERVSVYDKVVGYEYESYPGFELQILEKRIYSQCAKYIFGVQNLLDKVALTVLAGHRWAKNRNFDTFSNETVFVTDKEYVEKLLEQKYSGKTLKEIIDEMINVQAEVIYLRRIREGKQQLPDDYENDRMIAKRYVAFLFFEGLVKDCVEQGVCPDFGINLMGQEVIHLLKSLTIDDYCKIKGYLLFLERKEKYGKSIHGLDKDDYLSAMNDLDRAFLNCNCQPMKRVHSRMLTLIDSERVIKKAKFNTCSRLGHQEARTVEDFVAKYYSFVKEVKYKDANRREKEALVLLSDLYNKANSKIINASEFILKCMIASYVSEENHTVIRLKEGKQDQRGIKRAVYRGCQIEPLF